MTHAHRGRILASVVYVCMCTCVCVCLFEKDCEPVLLGSCEGVVLSTFMQRILGWHRARVIEASSRHDLAQTQAAKWRKQ